MSKLTDSVEWSAINLHFQAFAHDFSLKQAFQNDPDRAPKYSLYLDDILFDYSKNLINDDTLPLLLGLTEQADLKSKIEAMFNGELINSTEKRAVLHTALRNRSNQPVYFDGQDVMPQVNKELAKMRVFSDKVRNGDWQGYTGKPITDVVNIGIGGSDLGPKMASRALKPYAKKGLNVHYISNIDQADLITTLENLNPETTLFLIASKAFNTLETMRNATSAKQWFLAKTNDQDAIKKHFVAISTHRKNVKAFGIDPENMFEFWSWVGGRYSVWSAIGLSVAIYIGMDHFESFLSGAHEVDLHFRNTPFSENIPVIMALLGIWYNNFFNAETHTILAYDQSLRYLADYFQQGDMESNGKSIDINGNTVDYKTGPIIWGQPGTNGQHAFYQLIHQGTKLVPCDFLAAAQSHFNLPEHHDLLISNFLAQPEAMMAGKTRADVLKDLNEDEKQIPALVEAKIFPGNKPSNAFLFKQLTPKTLGSLIAFYEHKIFVQGVIWNINSFDQMGVELGKVLATKITPELQNNETISSHDSSTNSLINYYKKLR